VSKANLDESTCERSFGAALLLQCIKIYLGRNLCFSLMFAKKEQIPTDFRTTQWQPASALLSNLASALLSNLASALLSNLASALLSNPAYQL